MKLDRRRFPRFKISLPVEILGVDSETLKTTAIDISQAGMQIQCDTWTAHSLVPGGVTVTPSQNIVVTIMLCLPDPKRQKQTTENISIQCKVIYVLRHAQHHYIIGLEFLGVDEKTAKKLAVYLDNFKSGSAGGAGPSYPIK